jgi:hypothetical protein
MRFPTERCRWAVGGEVLDARCVRGFSAKGGLERREQKEEDKFMSDQKRPEVPEEVKKKQLNPEELTEEQLRQISAGGQPPTNGEHG